MTQNKRFLLFTYFAVSFATCFAVPAFAIYDDDTDLFRHHRFGFSLGYSSLNYEEQRQYQPALSTGKVALSGPNISAYWLLWLVRDHLDTYVQGELFGSSAEKTDAEMGLRLHQFWHGPLHTSIAFGPYGAIRFQPALNKGYSNVYGAFVQPSIGYGWNKKTSYPQEVSVWGRWGRPLFGGEIAMRESLQWALGLNWRFPISKPPAFPTLFFERVLVLGMRYESSKIQFNETRTVYTQMQRYVFSLGYEF